MEKQRLYQNLWHQTDARHWKFIEYEGIYGIEETAEFICKRDMVGADGVFLDL